MATDAETAAMRRAIALAATGLGTTSPNPLVGAVILSAHGDVVGEGAHIGGPGQPHAEVNALAHAGDTAHGGTAVVTLEPCSHHGRTGPCTEALMAAGITRVVYAVADPNPIAAGGAEALRSAGVDVEGGVLAYEATRINEAWLFAAAAGRPFVTWKYAASLDGRSAAADGTSRWISSDESRADVHQLRAAVDAVLVGTGTALADDPALTVRAADGVDAARQPWRVVVGRRRLRSGMRVEGDRAILVTGSQTAVGGEWAEVIRLSVAAGDGFPLPDVLNVLFERGIRHVLLEGGPTLAGAFVQAGLVDRVVAYLAPVFLGAGASALGDAGVATLADAAAYDIDDVTRIGTDVRITARPRGVR